MNTECDGIETPLEDDQLHRKRVLTVESPYSLQIDLVMHPFSLPAT